MDNRLEMEVDKYQDMLCDRVMGRNNGATRIVGFMIFGEKVESGFTGIRDWQRKCLEWKDHREGQNFEGG